MRVLLMAALCVVLAVGQVGAAEKSGGKSSEVKAPEAKAAEVKAPEAKTAEVKAPDAKADELKTQKDKVSYSLGLDLGGKMKNQMKSQSIEVDPELFSKGIRDALSEAKPLMNDQEVQATMETFQKDLATRQVERDKVLGEKNKKEGEAFLAANKKKDGVKVLPSGLQYKVLNEGKGKMPKATDKVTVNYRGTLVDGTEFDSSYKRGQPASFQVSGVIPGWIEALQLMKEGSKWQLVIPSNLAYGERGTQGGPIGPNAVLIFEVELMSIKDVKDK